MAKTKKLVTNDQALKNLLKALNWENPIFFALLRERILTMANLTEQSIKEEPAKWHNGIVHPNMYIELNRIIREHLNFE